MDPNTSNSRNQPQSSERRNDDSGQASQINTPTILLPANSPGIVRRTLVIKNNKDIVGELSALSRAEGHAIHILGGTGYISRASYYTLSFPDFFPYDRRREIVYVNGYFQPSNLVFDGPNSVLHVMFSDDPRIVSTATSLIADGDVYLVVIFVGGLGEFIQPDEPDGPEYNMLMTSTGDNELAPQTSISE